MRGSPFFDGVPQMDATLSGQAVKLPIFYYDGTAIGAVFPARLAALRRLMPDPRFSPARLAPGVGAVAITCFEYRDTDIGPYNELAISVPLNEPYHAPNLPGRALLASLRRRQMHAWVQHLPVTTEIARAGGVELYNYPKFIGGIEFERSGTGIECRLSEGREHILTLSGALIPTPRSERIQLFSHLWMDGQPQGSEFKINAAEMGVSVWGSSARLELGTRHPIARELGSLLYSPMPVQYQYIARFEGILYGPEHLTLPLMERFSAHTATQAPLQAA
ncbi:MAG: acetoacetate decarboxylase family protein [Acidobacteriota bacterium]|nr:acetoacetate decarboxylase family protein [Acidobacteriota bacterium]